MMDIVETRTVEEIQRLLRFIVMDAQRNFDKLLNNQKEHTDFQDGFDHIFHTLMQGINEAITKFNPEVNDQLQFQNLVSIQHYVGIRHIEEFLEKNMPMKEKATG